MAPLATGTSHAATATTQHDPGPGTSHGLPGLLTYRDARILGSLTIPGRPELVRSARDFVAGLLGGDRDAGTAVLLTSETVTNAVLHSRSGDPGGTVTVTVLRDRDGLRVEVADAGSQLTVPVVKDGHGLFLVQTLAAQWGFFCADAGTTVWFCLPEQL